MEIKQGTYCIKNGQQKAIIEYDFDNYTIYVFHGNLSEFDILIKYKKENTRIRTPKHIHWVVDALMKMQANETLTKAFLNDIKACWNRCKPLTNNDYQTLKSLVEEGQKYIDLKEYSALNAFGEYSVEFLYVLMELLATQEKTNRQDAYMFGNIIDELLEVDIDIFKIISAAGFNGRK